MGLLGAHYRAAVRTFSLGSECICLCRLLSMASLILKQQSAAFARAHRCQTSRWVLQTSSSSAVLCPRLGRWQFPELWSAWRKLSGCPPQACSEPARQERPPAGSWLLQPLIVSQARSTDLPTAKFVLLAGLLKRWRGSVSPCVLVLLVRWLCCSHGKTVMELGRGGSYHRCLTVLQDTEAP